MRPKHKNQRLSRRAGNNSAGTNFYAFEFLGSITVGGTSASTISTAGGSDHLGANTTFNVALTGASGADLTVSAPLINQSGDFGSGAGTLTKTGAGTMLLSATDTYTGTTTVNGGLLQVGNGTAGSLNGTTGTALAFSGTGTLNIDEASGVSQGMKALTFSAGDGTVQSTNNGGTSTVTFTSLAARTAGATQNFVTVNGANGSTNSIVLTGQAIGFIDQGTFFDGGTASADFAYMNAAGTYVRGINYGTDANSTNTTASVTVLPTSTYAEVSGSGVVSGQTTATLTTLQLANGNNFTLAASQTLTVNGILKSGGTAATLSGGTGIQAASGAEMVIRTDQAGDSLTISTPILANGASSLTKSGAGTLALTAVNTYTGATTINAGTLQIGSAGSLNSGSYGGNIANTGTLQYSSSVAQTLSGNITGIGALIKDTSATGTLSLSGTNTFSGGMIIKAGTMAMTGSGVTSWGSGTVTIGDSANTGLAATWQFNGGSSNFPTVANPITVTGNGNDTISATAWSPTFTGTVTLSNNLNIVSNNTFGSTIGISGGITGTGNIVIQSNAANGTNGSQITLSGAAINNVGTITNSGTTTSTTASNTTISAVIGTNVTGVTQNSANSQLILSNIGNSFTGNIIVNLGTLVAGQNAGNSVTTSDLGNVNTAGRTITINNGGTLAFGTNNIMGNGKQNATNLPTITVNAGGALTTANYDVLGNLVLNGGTLTATGTNNGTTYQEWQFLGSVTVGGSAASTISSYSTAYGDHLGANTTFNVAATGASGADLTVSAPLIIQSGDFTNSGGALTKTGAGTMLLSGANTYTGGTSVYAGTLVAGVSNVSTTSGAFGPSNGTTTGGVTLGTSSGTTNASVLTGGAFIVANPITAAAVTSGTLTIGGSTADTSSFTGNIILNNPVTLQAFVGGTVNFSTGTWTTNNKSVAIGSSGNTGIVNLSNTLATSGGVSINYGTLQIGAANVNGSSTPITINGGTLDASGFADTIGNLTYTSGGLNLAVGKTLTASALTLNSNTITVSGAVSTGTGLYTLISGASLSGTNTPVINTSAVTGPLADFTAQVLGNSVVLQQSQNQTLTSASPATINIIASATTSISATLTNSSPSGSAALNVLLTDNGGSGGTVSSFGSSTGSTVAVATPSTISGTFTAGSTLGLGQTWSIKNTDSAAQTTSVTAGGTVNIYSHSSPSLSIASGNNQSIITGGTIAATVTLSDTAGTTPAPLDVSGLSNLTGTTTSPAVASGATGTYTATGFATTTVGSGQTLAVGLNAGDQQSVAGAGSLGALGTSFTYNVYGHASPSAVTGGALTLGNIHAGYGGTVSSGNSDSVTNGSGGSYIAALAGSGAQIGGTTSGLTVNSIGGSQTITAGTSANISASLATGLGVGAINQSFTYTFADDSTLSGHSANVGTASLTLTGQVYSGLMTWNGPSGDNYATNADWTDSTSSSVHVAPGLDSGFPGVDTATFGGTSSSVAVNLNGATPNLNAVTFNGTGTYTIAPSGSGGSLTLAGSSPSITVAGGTQTISAPITLAANLTLAPAATSTLALSGNIGESPSGQSITMNGGGMAILSGSNSYSGGTIVTAGTLTAGVSNATGTGAFGPSTAGVTLGGGSASASVIIGGGFTVANPITVAAGSGTFSIGGGTDNDATFSGAITLNAGLTVSQATNAGSNFLGITGGITGGASGPQTVTFAGPGNVTVSTNPIADNGSTTVAVTLAGGTLNLTGSNAYSGATTIQGGTLIVSNASALGTAPSITFSSPGGTLEYNGTNTDYSPYISNSTTAPISINTNGQSVTYASALASSNTAGLTVGGAGSLTLTAANAYGGTTTINSGGTLQLGNGTTGKDGTILTSSGIVNNGTLVYNRFANLVSNVPISGGGVVTVEGAAGSSQAFTGNNTYTGGTNVLSAGTLLANSSNSTGTGTVNVGSGGVLGGSGTIANNSGSPVTINSGGVLSPGTTKNLGAATDTIATLNTGDLTLNAGGQLDWKLNVVSPPAQSAGDTSDLVVVNGTLNVNITGGVSGTSNSFMLMVDRIDGGIALSPTGTYTLFTAANVIGGDFTAPPTSTSAPVNISEDFSVTTNTTNETYEVMLVNTGGTGSAEYAVEAVAPEPSSLGLLGIASLGLLRRRRANRRLGGNA